MKPSKGSDDLGDVRANTAAPIPEVERALGKIERATKLETIPTRAHTTR
jgi:hypothetical protein